MQLPHFVSPLLVSQYSLTSHALGSLGTMASPRDPAAAILHDTWPTEVHEAELRPLDSVSLLQLLFWVLQVWTPRLDEHIESLLILV
jgi:hypothetical protein